MRHPGSCSIGRSRPASSPDELPGRTEDKAQQAWRSVCAVCCCLQAARLIPGNMAFGGSAVAAIRAQRLPRFLGVHADTADQQQSCRWMWIPAIPRTTTHRGRHGRCHSSIYKVSRRSYQILLPPPLKTWKQQSGRHRLIEDDAHHHQNHVVDGAPVKVPYSCGRMTPLNGAEIIGTGTNRPCSLVSSR